ncbi:BadF/BadG/BcrA/BcrD ATPase family protein [Halotalea alkalilenta]|uniref:BadF/BadG/BcrA/BcrD ATPase family protein n=1 Tax=Halotalea alkalilenta TaxID=376489 RepID=UPI0004887970|nr:BadF/BadG/BcrA/BcrD ATPase family protein [Halotalea alkalilenta]
MRVVIGIDGGGSGTRLLARDRSGRTVSLEGGPSGLSLGIERAWATLEGLIEQAHRALGVELDFGRVSLCLGLAGVNQPQWRAQLLALVPEATRVRLESDAYTTLIGAHRGSAGAIIALGTGSVGEALLSDGRRIEVGGYGFPSGDDASGAWFGLRATLHLQRVLDRRAASDDFSRALAERLGVDRRQALIEWLTKADQTAYAELAPVVLAHPEHPMVSALIIEAEQELQRMLDALCGSEPTLPVALCGGFAKALSEHLAPELRARFSSPQESAVAGALRLASALTDTGH